MLIGGVFWCFLGGFIGVLFGVLLGGFLLPTLYEEESGPKYSPALHYCILFTGKKFCPADIIQHHSVSRQVCHSSPSVGAPLIYKDNVSVWDPASAETRQPC
jgi:hypothetical protein